jgi:hypothetical protein
MNQIIEDPGVIYKFNALLKGLYKFTNRKLIIISASCLIL